MGPGNIRIGISSCLLGKKVRYDGGHKKDLYLTNTFGKHVQWVPVCPEVEYGLPVPREEMRLVGNPAEPSLVTTLTGKDHTEGMKAWAEKKLKVLDKEDLCGFIFKSKSPSSGYKDVKVHGMSGMPGRRGSGIFASAFMNHFPIVPVEDEDRLHDLKLRENFIERVFVFKRWKDFLENGGNPAGLASFHTDIKLLLMSHSQKHYSMLGCFVAEAKTMKEKELFQQYIKSLMEGLSLITTVKKNTNVLMHIAGYFKKKLTPDKKAELLRVIMSYHEGLVPLMAPIALVNHYVSIYNEPYLKRQLYLNTRYYEESCLSSGRYPPDNSV